jgi:hypothetical protein
MKKLTFFVAALALCTILSISAFAQKPSKSTSCGSDVTNLSLTVEAGAYNIQHDGVLLNGLPAPYATKKTRGDQIEAKLQIGNCSHDFTLNLNFSPRYMQVNFPDGGGSFQAKSFNFDRVGSVPITPTNQTASEAFAASQFCTAAPEPISGFVVGKNPDGTYKDNYGGCGIDENGHAFVRRNVGISLDDATNDDYRLRFQYSPIDGNENGQLVAGTSFIKVYHPDANTWILTPEVQLNTTTNAQESLGVKLQFLDRLYSKGIYNMPFRFILKRI